MVRKLDSAARPCSGRRWDGSTLPPSATPSCALTGASLRADIGSPVHWRVTFRGDTLARLERVDDGRLQEWVERSADRRVQYRSEELAAPSPSSSNAPMPFTRSIRRSGISSLRRRCSLALSAAVLPNYGFAGGGLPSHVRTMAIQPFDNETPNPELQRELLDVMRKELQSRLGVRDAPESRSDARRARASIRSYDADVPVAYSANATQSLTARRLLRITLDVQIVDQTTNKTIWEKQGLQRRGRVRRARRGRRSPRGSQAHRERHRRRSAVAMVRSRRGKLVARLSVRPAAACPQPATSP